MKYVAIINMPGYLPDSDSPPPVFDTSVEAWAYLVDSLTDEERWEPADPSDPDGPQSITELTAQLEWAGEDDGSNMTGTIYGPTYAYSVDYAEDDE
jgi:hypothetical protein